MIIFSCSPADDEAIKLAREWIATKGYTQEEVKIKKNDKYVSVWLVSGDVRG